MAKPQEILTTHLPESKELPPITLYMDQLLELLDQYLLPLKRQDETPVFTKTMINNYVKSGVVTPPIKKKYTHDSVIELMMIYYFKQVLSISDTHDIIKNMHLTNLSEGYDHFKKIVEETGTSLNLSHQFDALSDTLENPQAIKETIIALTIESAIKKLLAESLIDQLKGTPSMEPTK